MNKEHKILLRLVLPVLAINLLCITTIHAADDETEKAIKNTAQTKSMPAAPAGPYRSLHDMKKNSEPQTQQRQPVTKSMPKQAIPNFDNRQWTTPTPPQWNQAQPQQRMPMPAPQWQPTQPQQRMPMPATGWNQVQPQNTPPNFNNRQWMPPAPSQWAQQQWNLQQRRSITPHATQNFNNRQWTTPPQRNQRQWNPQGVPQQQQMAPPQTIPNFNNRQWTPPAPPQWNQQRQVVPPTYAPFPQNRGW